MDYATDRLDRRARGSELHHDYETAIATRNHALLAQTLRDQGRVKQAMYHYGQAWIESNNWKSCGDYAQATELAGHADLGVTALLCYQLSCPLREAEAWGKTVSQNSNGCGCGCNGCSSGDIFVPMALIDKAVGLLQTYQQAVIDLDTQRMSAYQIQVILGNEQSLSNQILLPDELRFINSSIASTASKAQFPLELQLLLVKLLYLTIPTLAADLCLYMIDQTSVMQHSQYFAREYKSHWAYFVFVKALLFGQRIKPAKIHRLPAYHIPVWDILWKSNTSVQQQRNGDISTFLQNLNLQYFSQDVAVCNVIELPETDRLYFIGDSHVLSLAWQTVKLKNKNGDTALRTATPLLVTGLKAWHFQKGTQFFTHACLRHKLQSLSTNPAVKAVVIFAGEIDCREGLGGPKLEGYSDDSISDQNLLQHVQSTVRSYVDSLVDLAEQYKLVFLVAPVAPHTHTAKGRVRGQAVRRRTTELWNKELSLVIYEKLTTTGSSSTVYHLDYVDQVTVPGTFELQTCYDADSTHMNSAFLPLFESAINNCGCNVDIL